MKKLTLSTLAVIVGTSLILPGAALAGPDGEQTFQPTMEKQVDKNSYAKAHPVFSWDSPGKFSPVLHPGSARGAGLRQEPLNSIDQAIEGMIENNVTPGAVTFVARRGHIVQHEAYGHAALYSDSSGTVMDKPVSMEKDTIFDMASISKMFTTTAAMQLYEQNYFNLDDPVAQYIPEFAQNGKENVTIRQLMNHTSGFAAWIPLYSYGETREDRIQYVNEYGLQSQPGAAHRYSDLNMIALATLIETLSGQRLDEFVYENITGPLGMSDTMYNPPESLKPRIAAAEYQSFPARGMVWGEVHDENAWALDGVAGHAGIFSTAEDLAVFAHMFLNEGRYGGTRILEPETVEIMTANQTEEFPGANRALGWQLAQGFYMDALSEGTTFGHTGFTGTSLVINKNNGTIAILLTNRVHPSRSNPSTNPGRQEFARAVADAIPVAVPGRDDAWFSGYGNNLNRSLTAEVELNGPAVLSYNTWYRTEAGYDRGYVEVSADGENWTNAGEIADGSSGTWLENEVIIPEDTSFIRFRYSTDGGVNGRGWYVHNIKLTSDGMEANPEFSGEGWSKRRY